MGLRLLALLSLVSIALAQTTVLPQATPVPTPMPTTMATDAPTTATEASTTDASTTVAVDSRPLTQPAGNSAQSLIDLANENRTLSDRYGLSDALQTRAEHFFCPEQGVPFVRDMVDSSNTRTIRTWTIMLQYPILAYLDSVHKVALINAIVNIVNLGNSAINLQVNDVCIGYVFHYDVSLYTESVLFQIYMRNQTNPPASPRQLYQAFETGRNMASMYIADFQGRQAIVLMNGTAGEVNQNVHPGAFRPDGYRFDPSDDPTLRAVILGNWPRGYTLEEIMTTASLNSSVTANFAANPDPVFYGLTGGDIVFAIIASILCAVLAFLMVFGFCIHPFLM